MRLKLNIAHYKNLQFSFSGKAKSHKVPDLASKANGAILQFFPATKNECGGTLLWLNNLYFGFYLLDSCNKYSCFY